MRRPWITIHWRHKFRFAIVVCAFWGGVSIAFFALELINGTGHPHPAKAEVKAARYYEPSGPEQGAAALEFAHELEGVANQTAKQNHGPAISHVSCVQGGPDDFFCAYLIGKVCHAAQLHRAPSTGEIQPVNAGLIDLPVDKCGAINAIRSLK